jgi:hypothetical protein
MSLAIRLSALALITASVACVPASSHPRSATPFVPGCCSAEGEAIAARFAVTAIAERRFTHDELWAALDPFLRSSSVRAAEAGRSIQGRPIRTVSFGSGPTTVLLWSQMHGDESTATMALADIIAWLASPDSSHAALKNRLRSNLRIVMVPMLNPDGAELFQRENAVGIDINRDARNQVTPEARTLKALRDSLRPDFGFNLHDQNARTLTGPNGTQVAIALLAPAADEERTYGPVRSNARQLASVIATVLQGHVGGRLTRYSDAHEPRAFGDLMQKWGTSTVLIESGALPGDPQKQKLRRINVIAILSALDAIATKSWRNASADAYESIPSNSRSAVDLLIRGGSLVLPGAPPFRADVAVNYDNALERTSPRVRDVGDLAAVVALDTIDASGQFLHPDSTMLTVRGAARWMRFDTTARITIRRGSSADSELLREIGIASTR